MRKFFLVFIIGVFFFPGCATTSDIERVDARIAAVKKQNADLVFRLSTMEKSLASQNEKNFDLRGEFAGQDAEFDRLRNEVRSLKGGYEEIEHRVGSDMAAINKELKGVEDRLKNHDESLSFHDKRLGRLETYMGLEAIDKFKARVESSLPGKKDINSLSEDELYEVSMQAYSRGGMETALEGLQTFLKKYPKSDKADNARFWTGEIYFSEKWYEKAILEYEDVIKSYPKGNKVAAAYLKQGIAFSKLGENANARLILKELIQKFPDSNEAKAARHKIAETQ
ncbi:MAG: tol-pal system protein YbgF [Deltaproteobacteria bacterium]|nr:tol-pal system protein YbgF [Deltaproteobacteria bacterium]